MISALPYALSFVLESKGISFTLKIETGIVALMVLCSITFKPLIEVNRDRVPKRSRNTSSNTDRRVHKESSTRYERPEKSVNCRTRFDGKEMVRVFFKFIKKSK